MENGETPVWYKKLNYSEAVRAGVCMVPMIVAPIIGLSAVMVSLGQAGFFYSTLPVPSKIGQRLVMLFLILGIGLGFYLIGGNVVFYFWLSILFTFMISFNIALLSSWSILSMMAFSFISIYSAGLNSGSAENTTTNFLAFAFAMLWSGIISMIKIWKALDIPKAKVIPVTENIMTGMRLGVGTSLALFISNIFEFSKLGWAPSAVGNVIRFDEETSKQKAVLRTLGTLGGAAIAIVVIFFIDNVHYIIIVAYLLAVLNGLFKSTKLGAMPLFYTGTILLLYSSMDLSASTELAIERIIYNLIGVVIALMIVFWTFPLFTKKLKELNIEETT